MVRKILFGIFLTFSLSATAETEALSDSSRVVDLDEVVVVSQPKEQFRLRQQPLASSVFSGMELQRLNIRDVRDLSQHVPSFVMPSYGSRYTSAMYVRGIGARENQSAVGMYIDNIPIVNKSMFNYHTYGVDRIDVLRGPQGTLYGQNTEGGLVRLYTKSPLYYQGTDLRLGLGSALQRVAEVAHYGRLGSKAGFSLAGFYEGRQGFLRNVTLNDYADGYDEAGARLRLMVQPSSRLTFDLMADFQHVFQNGFAYGELDSRSGCTQQPAVNRQGTYRRNMLTTGLSVKYAGRGFEVNSVTSWQHFDDLMRMDIDYTPRDLLFMTEHQHQNALTEELSVKSVSPSRWQWTFGIYGSRQWLRNTTPVEFLPAMNDQLSAMIERYAYEGMLNAMAQRMGHEAAAAMIARAGGCHIRMDMERVPGDFRMPATNLAAFHESNVRLTERLTATLGLRYDFSRVGIDYLTSGRVFMEENVMGTSIPRFPISLLLNREEQSEFSQLLPKVGLTWRLDSQGSNVYATWSKGYRAGGFNMQMFSDILQSQLSAAAQTARGAIELAFTDEQYEQLRRTISYKPEESWNYETGAHLNLFRHKVQLDLSAYYLQIRNQQLSVFAADYGFGRMMVNAGKSYSCGMEASLRGSALDNRFSWMLSYGYTHAAFKEYTDQEEGADGQVVLIDYKGNKVPFVPEHTMGAAASYRLPVSDPVLHSVDFALDLSGCGCTYWDADNTYSQPFYVVLGSRVSFDMSPVEVSVWARNLTSTRYNTFAFYSSTAHTHLAQRANPFQLGFDVRLHL